MDMAPGDAVDLMAPEGATAQDLAAIRHDLGLDKPVVLRYIDYMLGMLQAIWAFLMSKTDVFSTYAKTSGNTDTFLASILFLLFYQCRLEFIQRQNREVFRIISAWFWRSLVFLCRTSGWDFADHRVFPSPSLVPVRRRSDLVSNRTSC